MCRVHTPYPAAFRCKRSRTNQRGSGSPLASTSPTDGSMRTASASASRARSCRRTFDARSRSTSWPPGSTSRASPPGTSRSACSTWSARSRRACHRRRWSGSRRPGSRSSRSGADARSKASATSTSGLMASTSTSASKSTVSASWWSFGPLRTGRRRSSPLSTATAKAHNPGRKCCSISRLAVSRSHRSWLSVTGFSVSGRLWRRCSSGTPGRGVRLAISLDGNQPAVVDGGRHADVLANPRRYTTTITVDKPGRHTLSIWMVDPGVIINKITLYTKAPRTSYLGPPESYWR